MLDRSSPWYAHAFQNIALISVSLFVLPLDTFIVIVALLGARIWRKENPEEKPRAQKRVLVTGVGMTKGLALARIFAAAGYTVVGADFSSIACGRVSHSLSCFYTLRQPDQSGTYAESLLEIVTRERIDLWISCSGVASAAEDGEAMEVVERRTSCKAVQYDTEITKKLHDKDSFIEYTASLGLAVPETHRVTEKLALRRILSQAGNMEYIAKSVGVDDANRGNMDLLSKESLKSNQSSFLDRISISEENPWILQQFIRGDEFCTHALVVRGRVEAFVACPSSEFLMHYEALPAETSLSKAMLLFTEVFAAKSGVSFTGHLSFDFLVENPEESDPSKVSMYPIECNPRAHTAVVLFSRDLELTQRYMTLIPEPDEHPTYRPPLQPNASEKYHWTGHDLVTLILLPLKELIERKRTLRDCFASSVQFLLYMLTWKDGTFELYDPLPWLWLYHVYMPLTLLQKLVKIEKWSRLNVSTTKIFMC